MRLGVLVIIMQQGTKVSCGRTFLKVLMKQWIMYTFGKILGDMVFFWGVFIRQGIGCGEICHTLPSLS